MGRRTGLKKSKGKYTKILQYKKCSDPYDGIETIEDELNQEFYSPKMPPKKVIAESQERESHGELKRKLKAANKRVKKLRKQNKTLQ